MQLTARTRGWRGGETRSVSESKWVDPRGRTDARSNALCGAKSQVICNVLVGNSTAARQEVRRSLRSTASPVAEEVAHGEGHALVPKNAVSRGYVIEEMRNREGNEKLATRRA